MFVNPSPKKREFSTNPRYDIQVSSIYKPQIYNPLMVEKTGKEGDKDRAFVRVKSDIELLKAEEWLIQEHPEVLQDFAKRAAAYRPSDALDKLKETLSDDDLALLIKSRHLQSPAEIEEFYMDLSKRNISYNECLQSIIAAKQKEAEEAALAAEAAKADSKAGTSSTE